MVAYDPTPLWPAGHLPHKGGDHLAARLSFASHAEPGFIPDAGEWRKRFSVLISPLGGEMAGRPEGGIIPGGSSEASSNG